jgi:hypothetical protein
MATTDTLLPLGEVTRRLRVLGQRYVGIRTIPIESIVGSVDRAVDFDRMFKPRARDDLRHRLKALRIAFADKPMPPISVYEASGLHFVSDGHHRVALARLDGAEFIDAEVTAVRLSHALHRGVDLLELVHTAQSRRFLEKTRLSDHQPEARIEFSRPGGYWELQDLIEARGYEISAKRGELVPMPEATADWYQTCWLAAQDAIDSTGLRARYSFKTPGDLYLWVHYKLRELRTIDPAADWKDAAAARASEPVSRQHREWARLERRTPLPEARTPVPEGRAATPVEEA